LFSRAFRTSNRSSSAVKLWLVLKTRKRSAPGERIQSIQMLACRSPEQLSYWMRTFAKSFRL
jgi:hypothetical protein